MIQRGERSEGRGEKGGGESEREREGKGEGEGERGESVTWLVVVTLRPAIGAIGLMVGPIPTVSRLAGLHAKVSIFVVLDGQGANRNVPRIFRRAVGRLGEYSRKSRRRVTDCDSETKRETIHIRCERQCREATKVYQFLTLENSRARYYKIKLINKRIRSTITCPSQEPDPYNLSRQSPPQI